MFSGGQIGFDEGGVLQALSKPVFTTKVTHYERNRKGEVTSKYENDYTISIADVLVAAAMIFGPIVFLKLWTSTSSAMAVFPEGYNPLAPREVVEKIVFPARDLTPEQKEGIIKAITKVLDPFGLFG